MQVIDLVVNNSSILITRSSSETVDFSRVTHASLFDLTKPTHYVKSTASSHWNQVPAFFQIVNFAGIYITIWKSLLLLLLHRDFNVIKVAIIMRHQHFWFHKEPALAFLFIIWRTCFHHKEPFVKQKGSSDVKGSLWNHLDKKVILWHRETPLFLRVWKQFKNPCLGICNCVIVIIESQWLLV